MKYLITLVAMAFLVSDSFAATPTPAPTVTPTPIRSEVDDYRVPMGSMVMYGSTDPTSASGVLVRIKVNSDGVVMTMPVPTPTP